MEFKQLLGNRIYLEIPGRLKVYAVGNTVEHIKPGDEIMVDPSSAARGVVKIPLSEDKEVIMISTFDVAHIW